MGTTCVRPFSLSPFFSCPPGGGGNPPRSRTPQICSSSCPQDVAYGSRRHRFTRVGKLCSRLLLFGKRDRDAINISREYRVGRKRVSFLPRGECTRHIPGVAGGTRQLRQLENAYVGITIAVILIFFSVRCNKFSFFLLVNHYFSLIFLFL